MSDTICQDILMTGNTTVMMKRAMMRTTIRLDDALLGKAKSEARQRHTTLTCLIEEGLQLVLAAPKAADRRHKVVLPVSRERGGTLSGVDLNDSAGLLDLMEARR